MDVGTMPNLEAMVNNTYAVRDWLLYYKNIWNRNLTARVIDMQSDLTAKAINPEMLVESEDHREVPVKERLEHRKILVQDCKNLIGSIEKLLALSDEELAKFYGEEALKVATDMLQKDEEATAKPVLLKYKVLNEQGISMPDGNIAVKGTILELDPKNEDTVRFVTGGFIALDGAPSPEAKV